MHVVLPLIQVAFQFVWPCQCWVIPYLHEDLINRCTQQGEIGHRTRRRSGPSFVPSFIRPSRLSSFVLAGVPYLSLFLDLPPRFVMASFAFIYFMALYSMPAIVFESFS